MPCRLVSLRGTATLVGDWLAAGTRRKPRLFLCSLQSGTTEVLKYRLIYHEPDVQNPSAVVSWARAGQGGASGKQSLGKPFL